MRRQQHYCTITDLLQHTVDFSANEMYCFLMAVPSIEFLRFISLILDVVYGELCY